LAKAYGQASGALGDGKLILKSNLYLLAEKLTQQPRCLSLLWFQRNPISIDWVAQREVVAAFDE
jgi:hypothetical protein